MRMVIVCEVKDVDAFMSDQNRAVRQANISTFASGIIKCTEPMGHKDIKTTMIYKHALIDPKADQEEAEDMATTNQGET